MQPPRIEHEQWPSVAEHGGAREALDPIDRREERLEDRFLFSHPPAHRERGGDPPHPHHREWPRARGGERGKAEELRHRISAGEAGPDGGRPGLEYFSPP